MKCIEDIVISAQEALATFLLPTTHSYFAEERTSSLTRAARPARLRR